MVVDLLNQATPSLEGIAKRAHLSPDTIRSYKKGRRIPRAAERRKLAAALRELSDVLRDGARKLEAMVDLPRRREP